MGIKKHFFLVDNEARRRCADWALNTAPDGWHVLFQEPGRTLDQNAALWPILDAFARQIQWPVNGKMEWLESEEWKAILTAAFRKETGRLAAGIDGGVVMLGSSTSKMAKREFSEFLEFLHCIAAQRGVNTERKP